MANNIKEQEREELHKAIWNIANDLRGSVDGWDFKQYVLGFMFYRYISENITNYLNKDEHAAGNQNFDYAKLSDTEAEQAHADMVRTKGFFILPSQLFCNVREKAKNDENLNETLEKVFDAIENSAKGSDSEDDFKGLFDDLDVNSNELLTERDMQDYQGRYNELYEEWKRIRESGNKEDITDDIVFEIELVKQIEINIDYILLLVKKYHDSHCEDKEVLISIHKAIDSSLELLSKRQLIDNFIAGINDVDDVMIEWRRFVVDQKEKELAEIIKQEGLKEAETRKFIEYAFRDGALKTTGTDVDQIMPAIRRFGNGNLRDERKRSILEKLQAFYEKYFGIS